MACLTFKETITTTTKIWARLFTSDRPSLYAAFTKSDVSYRVQNHDIRIAYSEIRTHNLSDVTV